MFSVVPTRPSQGAEIFSSKLPFNICVNPDILQQIAWHHFYIYGTYQWIISSFIVRGPKLNTWLRRVAFRDILPDHPENVRAMIRAYL
jgi:hypothetical protein